MVDHTRLLAGAYRELLPAYFIVSQVELVEELADGMDAEGVAGLRLRIDAAGFGGDPYGQAVAPERGPAETHLAVLGRLVLVEALEHLDFAIKEFREMKMQTSLEKALRRKDILKA